MYICKICMHIYVIYLSLRKHGNIEILLEADICRWAGHVSRMEDHHLPKVALHGELSTGHRENKFYKDCQKKSLTTCYVDYLCCPVVMAAGRDAWLHSIFDAVNEVEEDRRDALKNQRSRRKAQAASNTTSDLTFTFGHCSHSCHSRMVHVSNERACR